VHLWIRAFIPNQHPTNPGYIVPIPGVDGRWVIPAPVGGSCFETDDRYFASDPDASYRVMAEVELDTDGQTVAAVPSGPRPLFNTGLTRNVDCSTGVDVVPPQRAATDGIHFGAPAAADGVAQIVVNASVGNPMYLVAPKIDYSGTFTYTSATKSLRFQGSVGEFPAFEAYAQVNGGTVTTVFTMPPAPNTTAWNLLDLGLGLFDQAVDTTVSLADQPAALMARPLVQAMAPALPNRSGRVRLLPAAFSNDANQSSSALFCAKNSGSKDEHCYSLKPTANGSVSLKASKRSKNDPELGLILPVTQAQQKELDQIITKYSKAQRPDTAQPGSVVGAISAVAGLRIAAPASGGVPARFVPSVKP